MPEMSVARPQPDRYSLDELRLTLTRAHGGEGEIRYARVVDGATLAGACNFIDLAVLPPGTSIGRHRHADTEEEFYLILRGEGRMWKAGEAFRVRAGDLVRNPPGASHGLANIGTDDLAVFVFEVRVP
jgi:mannose-6-phosphate isomerase-like protein (cupin superfamily)